MVEQTRWSDSLLTVLTYLLQRLMLRTLYQLMHRHFMMKHQRITSLNWNKFPLIKPSYMHSQRKLICQGERYFWIMGKADLLHLHSSLNWVQIMKVNFFFSLGTNYYIWTNKTSDSSEHEMWYHFFMPSMYKSGLNPIKRKYKKLLQILSIQE